MPCRDIKASNILVDKAGHILLADFGVSAFNNDANDRSERRQTFVGTPCWMAPEVIRQTGHGRPADVWSLGCTMLEMLTAKPPWSHFSSQISVRNQAKHSNTAAAATTSGFMLGSLPRERGDAQGAVRRASTRQQKLWVDGVHGCGRQDDVWHV